MKMIISVVIIIFAIQTISSAQCGVGAKEI